MYPGTEAVSHLRSLNHRAESPHMLASRVHRTWSQADRNLANYREGSPLEAETIRAALLGRHRTSEPQTSEPQIRVDHFLPSLRARHRGPDPWRPRIRGTRSDGTGARRGWASRGRPGCSSPGRGGRSRRCGTRDRCSRVLSGHRRRRSRSAVGRTFWGDDRGLGSWRWWVSRRCLGENGMVNMIL